ncbi:hypothetical protein ACH4OX_05935 [Streptomyces roseolus]|uniref:hypothetical protein n=1 Tax=Streptomyces roseolus TaxID=67358 RepID=UPI00378C13D2
MNVSTDNSSALNTPPMQEKYSIRSLLQHALLIVSEGGGKVVDLFLNGVLIP